MSISYNMIVGNKSKTTLPSIEDWNYDTSILRDPPKSIMTRRIDKVNQDGSLNEMYYHSGDRFGENIQVYARGVNPMVTMEYQNMQGGSNYTAGSLTANGIAGAPGKLPYRIMQEGAFHPPEDRLEQIYPLSGLPRIVHNVGASKSFKDYSKQIICQKDNYRETQGQVLKGNMTTNKSSKMIAKVNEGYVGHGIGQNLLVEGYTNKGGLGNTQLENRDPLRQALKEVNKYAFTTNPSSNKGGNERMNEEDIYLEKNIPVYNIDSTKSSTYKTNLLAEHELALSKNVPNYELATNKTSTHYTKLDNEFEKQLTRNHPEYEIYTNKGQNNFTRIDNTEMNLERNLPVYNSTTNISDNRVYVRQEHENELELNQKLQAHSVVARRTENTVSGQQNRTYHLPQTLNMEGFDGRGTVPRLDRDMNYNTNYQTGKKQLSQRINDFVMGRAEKY